MNDKPRVLIEEWLPAAAIGVECMRERSTGRQPPDKRFHVWWARRPLTVSRAAVLGSLLPADFPRGVFERLLGFGRPGKEIVELRRIMDSGVRLGGFGFDRAFGAEVSEQDIERAHRAAEALWGAEIVVIDPMAGGGSIPLESHRLGFRTLANEYNPVACSILEATLDYPFRFGRELGVKARKWGAELRKRFIARVGGFFPMRDGSRPDGYIFARTVPCPDTGHHTPLVPDWHLAKPKTGLQIAAEPIVDKAKGTWSVRVREIGKGPGQLREAPMPTYSGGKGISLFTGSQIPGDYIKAMAQRGEMKSCLYTVAVKRPSGLDFQSPEPEDLEALERAEEELAKLRPGWEKGNVIPTEGIPVGDKTGELLVRGIRYWTDMFSPRQLLCFGVLVEELRRLRKELYEAEGQELGEAVEHLLAFAVDKFANYNSVLASWHAPRTLIRSVFDRHDFAFKTTFTELATCNERMGIDWSIGNLADAFVDISKLPHRPDLQAVEISQGTATNLPQLADQSVTAVVVDPPYADNVQYSELADFFYVWLKRTQGHRRPEWFSTYLCEHDEEAVVNVSRHRDSGKSVGVRECGSMGEKNGGGCAAPAATSKTREARAKANAFYQDLMRDIFRESRRILRDDGVLTVMFTHKKQEAWEALFTSLIRAGFTITATWPVKTESEHSLHQAKKNAAQSTVLLVARKRPEGAGVGYFDAAMRREIGTRARSTAERLQAEGLNPVDQLVGCFGPAMEVYSRYDEVRTDTGEPVGVDRAIDEASDAVSAWRIEQLAARGLEGVEPEGRFYLLCWDVLGAAEFRFNEAKLLGHAVGMDVSQLESAGLVSRSSENIKMLSAKERRRQRALEPDEIEETLFGPEVVKKRRYKKDALKVHPNDPEFRTAIDACHALALRFTEAKGEAAGVGSAKALMRQQGWTKDSSVARLMSALVQAAPRAVWRNTGKASAGAKFPEFRAWHVLVKELFSVEPPDWTIKEVKQQDLFAEAEDEEEAEEKE